MFVDLVGVNSISNIIEQSGLPKFIIFKKDANVKSVPIFECLDCNDNKKAKQTFVNWANSILQGNPQNCNEYELFLFQNIELEEGADDLLQEDAVPSKKKGKAKSNKIRFTFSLCNQNSVGVMSGAGDGIKREDIATLINEAIAKREEDRTNNEILKRLTDMEARLEEEDEEEDEIGEDEDMISKITKVVAQLQGLGLNVGTKKPDQATINGIEQADRNVMENINRAIKILYKNNTQLDLDLLKLAEVSEKNPSQFKFLLNALRTM
jgi:hypothetical protein